MHPNIYSRTLNSDIKRRIITTVRELPVVTYVERGTIIGLTDNFLFDLSHDQDKVVKKSDIKAVKYEFNEHDNKYIMVVWTFSDAELFASLIYNIDVINLFVDRLCPLIPINEKKWNEDRKKQQVDDEKKKI